MTEIVDKYGKRVTRANGVLQDGDTIRVRLNMMDTANPALAHAAAAADAIKRAEAFDAGLHPQSKRYGTRDEASDNAREARDQRMRDAWKQPPSVTHGNATPLEQVAVVGPSAPKEQLFAARDQAVANRDRRLERAWESK